MTAIATPEAALHAFAAAWNGRDAAALAALFEEDADFVNVVGIWWRRRRAIEKAHDYALKRFFRDSRLTIEEVSVRHIGDDAATVHGRWRMEGQRAPDDTVLDPRRGVVLLVLRRTDDGWRAVAAQNTDIVPGAETMAASAGGLSGADYGGGGEAHRNP